MKATIIRKIEKEVKDIGNYMPIYTERAFTDMLKLAKDGDIQGMAQFRNDYYEGVQVWNPETKLKEVYYVKTDDKKLFKDLVIVSDSFVEKQLREQREKLLNEFDMNRVYALQHQRQEIRELSWWKRLFIKF